ncbi:MAG: protein kinase, partial [Sandaracinaceae bacterium]
MNPLLSSTSSRAEGVALGVAAESVLSVGAPGESMRSFVQQRALPYYAESLLQYLALRVGVDEARALFEELSVDATHTNAAPSAGAWLFARARERLGARVAERAFTADDAIWYRPRDAAYEAKLVALRRALDLESAELLELRFARGLGSADLSTVVGADDAATEAKLERALDQARDVLGLHPPSRGGTLATALLEAFALRTRGLTRPRSRPVVLEIGTVIGERYEIESHVGAGAFADVYRARDREVPDHVVALKLHHSVALDETARKNALRELHLIASVFHPSVVQLKDHGWHEQRLWFVMPFYRGETLATRLRRGPLTRTEAQRVFEPLARALAAMHRAGVRHQDVKPENIFLAELDGSEEGMLPILLDLGVAAKDAEVVLAGTPLYFAPEVAGRFAAMPDPPAVTEKADVFSLALSLRNALDPEGREEVLGGVVDEFVRHRAITAPAPAPAEGDLGYLEPYFARWLGLSPDERPTADELARELSVLSAPERRRERRNATLRWLLPSAVALAALFGAVTYVLSREASYQRVEAERARHQAEVQRARAETASERVETITADLYAESALRRELEQQITHLEDRYQSSRLTREELAARLARAQAELGALSEQHEARSAQLQAVRRELAESSQLNLAVRVDLETARAELEREHDRANQAEERGGDLRQQLVHTHRSLSDARQHVEALEARIASLERRLAHVPVNPWAGDDADEP